MAGKMIMAADVCMPIFGGKAKKLVHKAIEFSKTYTLYCCNSGNRYEVISEGSPEEPGEKTG